MPVVLANVTYPATQSAQKPSSMVIAIRRSATGPECRSCGLPVISDLPSARSPAGAGGVVPGRAPGPESGPASGPEPGPPSGPDEAAPDGVPDRLGLVK